MRLESDNDGRQRLLYFFYMAVPSVVPQSLNALVCRLQGEAKVSVNTAAIIIGRTPGHTY